MNWKELQELQERAARLTPEEQLYLVERLVASVRKGRFTDHAARDRDLETMASDPGVQSELDVWRTGDVHAAR